MNAAADDRFIIAAPIDFIQAGVAFGTASGENGLLKAYRKGSATFNDYVRKLRGDSREGEGVQPG